MAIWGILGGILKGAGKGVATTVANKAKGSMLGSMMQGAKQGGAGGAARNMIERGTGISLKKSKDKEDQGFYKHMKGSNVARGATVKIIGTGCNAIPRKGK